MTQIKGVSSGGCGGAAEGLQRGGAEPLKLNEVFIRRADSTLNTGTSRAVTVNVSLRSLGCLLSLAGGGPQGEQGKKKDRAKERLLHAIFFSFLCTAPSILFSHLLLSRSLSHSRPFFSP